MDILLVCCLDTTHRLCSTSLKYFKPPIVFDFLTTAELSKIDLLFSNLSNVRVTDSPLCLMNVGWNDENLSLVARVGHAWGIFDKTPSNQNKVYELLIKRRFGT